MKRIAFYLVILYPHINTINATYISDLPKTECSNPLLVAVIEGLGAKATVAQLLKRQDSISKDLAISCMNNLVAQGAIPLSFIKHPTTEEESSINSGFAMGIAEKNQFLNQTNTIAQGDLIIGVPCNGLQLDGFQAVLSLLNDLRIDSSYPPPFASPYETFADALIEPATLYAPAIAPLFKNRMIKAATQSNHGGITQSLARVIPNHLQANINLKKWYIPPIFRWIKQITKQTEKYCADNFSLGIGMALVVAPEMVARVLKELDATSMHASIIGTVSARTFHEPCLVEGTIGSSCIRVMIIGNGGREHALAWKLSQSPFVELICVAPGNSGTLSEKKVTNVRINLTHHNALITYARQNNIDLVIIGNSTAATASIVDECIQQGIRCLGPSKKAFQLIDSYAKNKIDISDKQIISFAVITDGQMAVPLSSCQQYLGQQNGNKGEVTPGMGACCPAPIVDQKLQARIMETIIEPVFKRLRDHSQSFAGFLSATIAITNEGNLELIELNCHLSEWDTLAIAMRLQTDLFTLCNAAYTKQLELIKLKWDAQPAVSILLGHEQIATRSGKKDTIIGVPTGQKAGEKLFHLQTIQEDAKIMPGGNRVLIATALGATLEQARNNAYGLARQIYWPGLQYRQDIGYDLIG